MGVPRDVPCTATRIARVGTRGDDDLVVESIPDL
jgi:hypothetical protein